MVNIEKLINACDTVQRRTIYKDGYMHTSSRCFDACMRAFDTKPSAESITFRIFLNAPIMQEGEVTIHCDGRMEMRTI